MNLQIIFDKLWKDYSELNPSVQKIHDLFTQEGENVGNDHIAFRTFNDPRIDIDVLSKIFLKAGYVESGEYQFKEKKLFAKHFEIRNKSSVPKIFISQLKLEECTEVLQRNIREIIDLIPKNMLESEELIFSGKVWGDLNIKTYEKFRDESEYAAWMYVYGFRANHFTINVNQLKKFSSIEKINTFLKNNGFLINDSGGEIKGSPAELLEQSSTKSEIIKVNFKEGVFEIPACYYEFAKRYPDRTGKLYGGFIAKSADKIFESTDFYKKQKD